MIDTLRRLVDGARARTAAKPEHRPDTGIGHERTSGWAGDRLWMMTRYALEERGEAVLLSGADPAGADAALGGFSDLTGRAYQPLAALICACGELRLCVVMYGDAYPKLKAVLVDERDRPLCGTEPFRLPAFHWTTGSWERLGRPMRPRQRRVYRESVRHQFAALTNAVRQWHQTWEAWGVASNDEAFAHAERTAREQAEQEAANRLAAEEQRREAERRRLEAESRAIHERLELYVSAGVAPPAELVEKALHADAALSRTA
jgi:hypothetical protein